MESWELMDDLTDVRNCKAAIHAATGVHKVTISGWTINPESGLVDSAPDPLGRIAKVGLAIEQPRVATNPKEKSYPGNPGATRRMLQWLADKWGHLLVVIPRSAVFDANSSPRFVKAFKEGGDVAASYAEGWADGTFTIDDMRRTLREVEEAIPAYVALAEHLRASIAEKENNVRRIAR